MFGRKALLGLLFAISLAVVGAVVTYVAVVPLVPLTSWAWLVGGAVALLMGAIVFTIVWSVFVAYFATTQMEDTFGDEMDESDGDFSDGGRIR